MGGIDMRKFVALGVIFTVLVLLFSVNVPAQAQPQIVMRLAETHAPDYPTTKADYEFARLVEERTNGRIKIEVYPSAQLGEEKAVIEAVQFGAIDFNRTSISPLSAFASNLIALQMPYLYRDDDHMWKVLTGPIGENFLKSLEQYNFVGLGWYDGGTRHFYNSKKEIKSVSDLKGMKIRVQESKLMTDLVSCLGAVPTPMPFGEVYSALQTGVIDGAENNLPSYYSTSHYEVAKYITLDGHSRIPEIIIASKLSWDKLSKEDQEIIRQAAKDSMPYQIKLWKEFEKDSEEKTKSAGSIYTELTPESLAEFQKAVQPMYDALSPELKEITEQVRSVR
jgi:tripartite ATP-independent transporter DctP family solute receptor